MTALESPPSRRAYAVDRDPRFRQRLLRQFDRGAKTLRRFLEARLGDEGLDTLIAKARAEYEAILPRVPWIGGSKNPRSFNLYGSALWLALWRVLEPRGVTLDEARGMFQDLYRVYWSRHPRFLRRLFGRARMRAGYQQKLMRLAALSEREPNPDDYVFRFVPGVPGRFDFGLDFVECAILKFLRSEGAEDLVPILCELDWVHTELIGIELMRSTTLAQGGDRCDFRFGRTPRRKPLRARPGHFMNPDRLRSESDAPEAEPQAGSANLLDRA